MIVPDEISDSACLMTWLIHLWDIAFSSVVNALYCFVHIREVLIITFRLA